MKLRSILLFLMLLWDLLSTLDILNVVNIAYTMSHLPAYINQGWFDIAYKGVMFLLMLTLLGSGTVVKTKNITNTHIHQDADKIARLEKEIEELRNEGKD